MNIQISEIDNGFYYKKNFFYWGDELINLANSDFSELKKLILVDEPDRTTYLDFFKPFFNLKTNSIHYNFICSSFIDFLEYYDKAFEEDFATSQINAPLSFLEDVQKIFYSLFNCQRQAKEILSCFIQESKRNTRLQNKAKFKIIYNNNPLNSRFTNDVQITQFDLTTIPSNFTMSLKDNTIIQNHVFFSITDFCNYELYKFIERNVKITNCDYCHKFIRIKNANTHYCSEQCRKLHENSNPFFTAYRTSYKNYSKAHHDKYCPKPFLNTEDSLRPQINKLYKEYKDFWQTKDEEKKLNEFKEKLRQFK